MSFKGIKANVVSFKGLNKQSIPYILIWIIYYTWIIAFTSWWTASPKSINVFGSVDRSLIQSIGIVSSAFFIFFTKKEWFIRIARFFATFALLGVALIFLTSFSPAHLIGVIILGISIGCISVFVFMLFVFFLNNTEKLYAIIGSNLLISLLSIFQNINGGNNLSFRGDLVLSLLILLIVLIAIVYFHRDGALLQEDEERENTPKMETRVYLTLFYNCTFAILCRGVGSGVLHISAKKFGSNIVVWYFIGGLIGCVVYYMIYAFFPKAIILVGNISFGLIVLGFLLNAFAMELPKLAIFFALLLGIGSTVGMIVMYYVIGVVGKKFNSLRYLKFAFLIVGVGGGVTGIAVGNIIQSINSTQILIVSSIVTVSFILSFMVSSPLLAQEHIYGDWAKDTEMVEIDNEKMYLFEKYHLSKREMEVCKLLLKGYTLRQISAILSISYSTVNTYCTNSYRKLNINSRTELLILFKDYIAN